MAKNRREEHVIKDGRSLPIFIHSTIDDMTNLSPNAMRVYMHLSRRADKGGSAWPSYQSIGDHCFATVLKHPDSRKKAAIESVADLSRAGLLKKGIRMGDHGQQSNEYTLIDPVTVESQPGVIAQSPPGVTQESPGGVTPQSQRGVTPQSPTPVIPQSPKDTPLEDTPLKGSPIEGSPSSSKDEDDLRAGDAIEAAWLEVYGTYMPENILQPMNKLLAQCNEAAVIHAIHASTGSQSRSFLYIAKCARNYIPPAPEADARSDYRVDLPPAPPPMAPALRPSPAVLPADPWAICLSELRRAYAGSDWIAMLDGSVLELAADGALDARGQPVPRYIVRVAGGVDVQRLANRAMRQIRFSLGTILGRTFMIEIVAAAAEKKPA